MKERPILFQGAMSRALLVGTKTQTRRPVKPQPAGEWAVPGRSACPYGLLGDQLWVREAWRALATWDTMPPRLINPTAPLWYEADGAMAAAAQPHAWGKLRPSMFMPRWASRIQLEISEVRVERLQDISEADAIAEGAEAFEWMADEFTAEVAALIDWPLKDRDHPHRNGYALLWDSINGRTPGASWADNPWVWAVSFQRIKPQRPQPFTNESVQEAMTP